MTATPIPRTVAMTIFGDLDVSTLTELPQGQAADQRLMWWTAVDRPHHLERAWQRVIEEVDAGRQAYVVCPRIGEDLDPVSPVGAVDGSSGAGDRARCTRWWPSHASWPTARWL